MSDKNAKALRKSVRNVVQQILPEILTSEMVDAIKKKLSEELTLRMDVIAKDAQNTLKNIDERQKDFQNFLVKEVAKSSPLPAPTGEVPPSETL